MRPDRTVNVQASDSGDVTAQASDELEGAIRSDLDQIATLAESLGVSKDPAAVKEFTDAVNRLRSKEYTPVSGSDRDSSRVSTANRIAALQAAVTLHARLTDSSVGDKPRRAVLYTANKFLNWIEADQ